MDEKTQGLVQKYRAVELVDGGEKYVTDEFFLLKFKDPHAQKALRAYAESCSEEFPQLSQDLLKRVAEYEGLNE